MLKNVKMSHCNLFVCLVLTGDQREKGHTPGLAPKSMMCYKWVPGHERATNIILRNAALPDQAGTQQ